MLILVFPIILYLSCPIVCIPQTTSSTCPDRCLEKYSEPFLCDTKETGCLCGDVDLLNDLAACIGSNCSPSELSRSANDIRTDCANEGEQMAISVQEFIDAGNEGDSNSEVTTAGDSVTVGTLNLNAGNDSGTGLTKDHKIALGVGIGFGLPTLFLGVLGLWIKRQRSGSFAPGRECARK
jgi:hypothetical protein